MKSTMFFTEAPDPVVTFLLSFWGSKTPTQSLD